MYPTRDRIRYTNHAAAFTLIELLVVVAIIALLMGLLLPALSAARDVARDAHSMSNVRQMLVGYAMYQQDHNNHVLFGYTPASGKVNGQPVVAYSPEGDRIAGLEARRYPWRLAPYVADMWAIIHSHPDTPPDDFYTRSVSPTYGINGVFVGGATLYLQAPGFVNGDQPNYANRDIVYYNTDVRHSDRLIVFTDAKLRNFSGADIDENTGYHMATPPWVGTRRWTLDAQGRMKALAGFEAVGLPEGYYTTRTITGFFDTHVQALEPKTLNDMRLWANKADAVDYNPF